MPYAYRRRTAAPSVTLPGGMTAAQQSYIASLAAGRDLAGPLAADAADAARGTLTKWGASDLIERLRALPPAPGTAAAAGEFAPVGIYLRDGIAYRVQCGRASGKTYALRLIEPGDGRPLRWEYAPGVVRALTAADRMSVTDAEAISRRIGQCVRCGATLTDPASVARGIGPICRARVGAEYEPGTAPAPVPPAVGLIVRPPDPAPAPAHRVVTMAPAFGLPGLVSALCTCGWSADARTRAEVDAAVRAHTDRPGAPAPGAEIPPAAPGIAAGWDGFLPL